MENGAMAMEIKTGVFLSSLREDQKKVVKLLTFLTIKNLKILQSWFPSSGQIEENIANDQNDIVVHWTRAFHHGISNLALTNGWFFWTWSTKGDLCWIKNSNSGRKVDVGAVSGNKKCGVDKTQHHYPIYRSSLCKKWKGKSMKMYVLSEKIFLSVSYL